MADQSTPQAPAPLTEEEIGNQLAKAQKANDWQLVAKLATQLATTARTKATAQRDEKEKALAEITLKVKTAIEKVLDSMHEGIAAKGGEGVWFSYEYGELNDKNVRVLKSAAKVASKGGTGGGGGKKYDIKTETLLEEYGSEVIDIEGHPGKGSSWQEFYNANSDSNSRFFKVRAHLLKKKGMTDK